MDKLLRSLGTEIQDLHEESFLVFSQSIPSRSLGFVDNKADEVDITVGGKDFTIHQSPSLLTSNRSEGTTGAVLWQVTPRFAEWISSTSSILFTSGLLDKDSTVLELGCGVSGLIALVLAPKVQQYILTDQEYVLKILRANIAANVQSGSTKKSRKSGSKSSQREQAPENIFVKSLDWENDSLSRLYTELGLAQKEEHIKLLISCDCIYNEALICPLVDTQASICRMALPSMSTVCIVAQQLRSPDIFESWLTAFHSQFRVWRVPDDCISPELGENSGFVVHIGLLRI